MAGLTLLPVPTESRSLTVVAHRRTAARMAARDRHRRSVQSGMWTDQYSTRSPGCSCAAVEERTPGSAVPSATRARGPLVTPRLPPVRACSVYPNVRVVGPAAGSCLPAPSAPPDALDGA